MMSSEQPLLVIFSDIEMGAGGVADDLPQSTFVSDILAEYNEPPHRDRQVIAVFNGDTFDFLKTSVAGKHPRHVDATVALAKLDKIATAHAGFFSAIREWLAHDRAVRQAVFVVGNHDTELLLPQVQTKLRQLLGEESRVLFPGLSWRCGDVRMEHGQQHDRFYRLDEGRPHVEHNEQQLLNLSWGQVALLDVVLPWHETLCHFDRLMPTDRVLDFYPELAKVFTRSFAHYIVRDFAKQWWSGADPMRRLSMDMLLEVVGRFRAPSIGVRTSDPSGALRKHRGVGLHVMGHLHRASHTRHIGIELVRTGCLRNEYLVDDDGRNFRLQPSVYAEVDMALSVDKRARLVERTAPAPPAGYMPESMAALANHVRRADTLARSRW